VGIILESLSYGPLAVQRICYRPVYVHVFTNLQIIFDKLSKFVLQTGYANAAKQICNFQSTYVLKAARRQELREFTPF
jgi:hypothetical protein